MESRAAESSAINQDGSCSVPDSAGISGSFIACSTDVSAYAVGLCFLFPEPDYQQALQAMSAVLLPPNADVGCKCDHFNDDFNAVCTDLGNSADGCADAEPHGGLGTPLQPILSRLAQPKDPTFHTEALDHLLRARATRPRQ